MVISPDAINCVLLIIELLDEVLLSCVIALMVGDIDEEL